MATTELRDVDPHAAVESLRAAPTAKGIVFPSLSVDFANPALKLVELGCVRADVAERLATALRRDGHEHADETESTLARNGDGSL